MTPTNPLRVDRRGFIWDGPVRLPLRYVSERRSLEYVVKDKRLRADYGQRREVSLSEIAQLERRRCQSYKKGGE